MKTARQGQRRCNMLMAWQAVLLGGALLLMATGCSSAAAQLNPPTPAIEASPTITDTKECPEGQSTTGDCSPEYPIPAQTAAAPAQPGSNEPPEETVTPTSATIPAIQPTLESQPCLEDICCYNGVLFLRRPIDPPGNDNVDVTYRFGSTQSGRREPHHGVELLNGFGTPVLAAGDGTVVVAGTDVDPTSPHGVWPIIFYGPYSNFYGNLVVIEHAVPVALQAAFPDLQGPIYTLYGHLSEMLVQEGQQVLTGQQIGKVGMAGIATGSHLHFEVRIGENSYKASHNPELWLMPHTGKGGQLDGAIAGRFLDSYGNSLEIPSITLQHLPDGSEGQSDFQEMVITYEEKGLISQPPFLESFGVGDLPAGLYRISFPMGGLRQELVQVYPGQLTVFTFRSN